MKYLFLALLFISCGKIKNPQNICEIQKSELTSCMDEKRAEIPKKEDYYYDAICRGEIKMQTMDSQQCEVVFLDE